MEPPDPYDQLLNVLRGMSADGAPRAFEPIPYPGDYQAAYIGMLIHTLNRDLEPQMPDEIKLDHVRTALIRTLLRWLIISEIVGSPRLKLLLYYVLPPPQLN